ncbi:MAG: DUF4178 domain-containing protein [Acidobacteria bacterium]|nr:MAG: DUF4178 domain-containing protein [Acidobacteriota bacterium]MCE7957461.1 DUF4178 domain-containing protein [Acidobacteria bacterium ACB2]
MSARAAQCPSCGGEVLFSAGSSLVAVCPQCRAAVSRKGVALESLGTVAELVPTSSPFRIGMDGRPKVEGMRPFRFVGRLQLSTGEGTWDEWHVAFSDGRYGWLAEAQGGFWVMRPQPTPQDPPAPEFEQLQPGMRLSFRGVGDFTVVERRKATYVSAEGELPFVAAPGSVFAYGDLSGSDGSLATLDYGDDPGVDAFFVGYPVALADLGIAGLEAWEKRKVSARAASLNCPSCGGALELKDPAATVRISCSYCGSLLGTDQPGGAKFEVLERLSKVPFKPLLPLGAKGALLGKSYVLLGALKKKCQVEGVFYYWTEYLLKETKTEAYHWLVESTGHWSLVAGVPAGKVSTVPRLATYDGRRYRHFQETQAVVDAVLGEFYWEVRRGETTTASDYVAPPRILSMERSGNEVTWSEGTYLDRTDVAAGFGLKAPLPPPKGIGSNQPWPGEAGYRVVMSSAKWLYLAAAVLFVFFQVRGPKKVVFTQTVDLAALAAPRPTPPPEPDADALLRQLGEGGGVQTSPSQMPAPAGEEKMVLSEPFRIDWSGNLEARLSAPTDNSWVFVAADLINEETGEVRSFGLQSDYYHGVDGGESWSEGSRSRSTYLSQVPKGRYVLRMEPEFEAGKAPATFEMRLRSGVPRVSRFVLLMVLLLIGPVGMLIARGSFEGRRWAESDYAGGDSSSSDDDDESGWSSSD